MALRKGGIQVPEFVGVVGGKEEVAMAASSLSYPLVLKPNCGGKGHAVRLFSDETALREALWPRKEGQEKEKEEKEEKEDISMSPDGVGIVQEYIESREPRITRVEMVGGRLLYAMYSSTHAGFQLCPADSCAPSPPPSAPPSAPPASAPSASAPSASAPPSSASDPLQDRFTLRKDLSEEDPLIQKYLHFMATHGIHMAGFEFIEDTAGRRYTYDINVTTNYSSKIQQELPFNCYDVVVDSIIEAYEKHCSSSQS